jgi:hypothetical protein
VCHTHLNILRCKFDPVRAAPNQKRQSADGGAANFMALGPPDYAKCQGWLANL